MRKKLALAALAVGLAATIAPLSSASAFCDPNWYALTGDCNPCYTSRRLFGVPEICLD